MNSSDSVPEVHKEPSEESTAPSATSEEHSSTPSDGSSRSQELSNLRLENQLLRNEVQSLTQEMASLLQRSKETQEGRTLMGLVKCYVHRNVGSKFRNRTSSSTSIK